VWKAEATSAAKKGMPKNPEEAVGLADRAGSVADHDQGFFPVEGPMTDDRPWVNAARRARDQFGRRVVCGPAGPDRNALAAEFQRAGKLAGVPPGSILRPHQ
jgi:hypothetical protein